MIIYLWFCGPGLHISINSDVFQEQEEQRRREQSEKEALERWKEEERRKSQLEIGELRQLFLQESKDMASKSSSIEAVSIHEWLF